MLLKVGELAKRAGLTVRALHHYDSIGLLCPSARSDAGYRLYNRDDIARLHQIQALRGFGVALADIGVCLDRPASSLPSLIDHQIAALSRQIEQAGQLHAQLTRLRAQMQASEEPDLAGWLSTLELMSMYDKYFSKEELASLPFFTGDQAVIAEWDALIARVKALMAANTPASSPEAGTLAFAWMALLQRDTAGNAVLANKLGAMQANEQALRDINGITPKTERYVREAMGRARLALFERHLTPAQFKEVSARYGQRDKEWPALIARVREAVDAGVAPESPAAKPLALAWIDLWRSFAGDDPATNAAIREAYAKEPKLMIGSFITDAMKNFIGKAIASLGA
jgi:DNA-binding transcriptional MerR regulator